MRSKSITSRLTLFFSTASTIVLIVMGVSIGALVNSHFEEEDIDELNGKLELVRHALAYVNNQSDFATISQHLTDALVGHDGLSIAVLGPDRRMLFISPGSNIPTFLHDQPVQRNFSGNPKVVMWKQDGEEYRGFSAEAFTNIAGQKPAIVALAINIGHQQAFMMSFITSLFIAITIGILLTVALGWIAARRGLAPLHKLTVVTKGISASRLHSRLPTDTVPLELVGLATAFNEMLYRLDNSFKRLSDFSSDLAHEIRTPISNIMTQTQVAISKDRSASEYHEILLSNLEECERLARIITDMLFLAKADNDLIIPSSENVNLHTELQEIIEFYAGLAEEKDIKVSIEGHGVIKGDRLMLRRAFSNLVLNAIRHTPSRESVKVFIKQEESSGKIEVTFENPGVEIPQEHFPRLFDRFYQVDSSRNKKNGGTGLGLAISKSIVEAHRGTIEVFSENKVTRFVIIFQAYEES